MVEERFKLTRAEVNTVLWERLTNHFNDRIAKLRADNDGDLDESATAKMRGRIAEIKALLALEKDLEATERDFD